MPDASGRFRGQGWSQPREDAWTRVFGIALADDPDPDGDAFTPEAFEAEQQWLDDHPCRPERDVPDLMLALEESLRRLGCGVPGERAHEVHADRTDELSRAGGWCT